MNLPEDLPVVPPAMPCFVAGPAMEKIIFAVANPHRGGGRLYTIWRARPASTTRPFYVVTEGEEDLELGDNELHLMPLDNLDFMRGDGAPGQYEMMAFEGILKEQGLALKIGKGENKDTFHTRELTELEALHQTAKLFYRLHPPYSRDFLVSLGDGLPDALELGMRGGYRVDGDQVFLFKPHLPVVEPSRIPPEVALRSAPHEIDITGTKPGKTHISRRLGLNVERPTPAGLLGYATADTREYGYVHGSRKTIFVDEVAQEPKEEVASFLPTYLETGEVHIARGCKIRIRGHGSVVFMSNPSQEVVYDPLQSFLGVLRALTLTNLLGLGSRIGIAYYNPGTEPAVNELHVDREGMGRLRALITSFQFHTASLLSAALQDPKVERWLEEGFPKGHLRLLDRAIGEVRLSEIQWFLTGYRDSHRHARGVALRVAFVDTAHLHLEAGAVQVQALLLRAKELWPTVLFLREESLQRLVRVAGDVEMVRRTLAARFRGFRHEYLRRGLVAIAAWWKERQEAKDEILKGIPFPFEDTRDPYMASPAHDRTLKRSAFSYLTDILERNVNELDAALRPFGFRVAVGSFGLEFAVVSQETFKIAMEVVAVEVEREPVHPSAIDGLEVGNYRTGDEKEPLEKSGDRSDRSGTAGGSGTPPNPKDGAEPSGTVTQTIPEPSGTNIPSSDKSLARGPGSGAVGDSLREDILRAIKLGDRGYGVPRTAVARRIAQDLGIELRRAERIVEEPLMDLLTDGELVEPRSGVFRLSKREGR